MSANASRNRDDAQARLGTEVAEHALRAAAMLSALEVLRGDHAPSVNHGRAWAEVRAWCREQSNESARRARHAADRLADLERANAAREAWIPTRAEP